MTAHPIDRVDFPRRGDEVLYLPTDRQARRLDRPVSVVGGYVAATVTDADYDRGTLTLAVNGQQYTGVRRGDAPGEWLRYLDAAALTPATPAPVVVPPPATVPTVPTERAREFAARRAEARTAWNDARPGPRIAAIVILAVMFAAGLLIALAGLTVLAVAFRLLWDALAWALQVFH